MKGINTFLYVISLAFLWACSSEKESTDNLAEESPVPTGNSFILSNEQYTNLNLELGEPESTLMSAVISATGMVDVPPENIAEVTAAISGKITRITHNVLPGKYVTKGSILASGESMELVQLQQDYLQAYLKNEVLSQELQRQKQLLENKAGIEKKVQEAENQWKLNKALISAYEAKLRIANVNLSKLRGGEITEYLSVFSPISGFIKAVNVHTGSNFTSSDVLFEIISKEHLHVELKVFEKDAAYVKEGQKVHFNDPVFTGKATGSVFLVAKNFDADSKTVNVHVHFDHDADEANLIPGKYLRGDIQVSEREVNTLPESALMRSADGDFVLVERSNENEAHTIEKIMVEAGVIQDGKVEIIQPVSLQRVIVKGGQRIAGLAETQEEE